MQLKAQSVTEMIRRTLVLLFKFSVTAAVIVYLVHRLGWSQIVATVAGASPLWMTAAVLLFALSGVLGAWQWHLLLLQRRVNITFCRATLLYFMGMFFNNFILGTAAADAVRVTYVKLGRDSGKAGFGATFLDRFIGLLALLMLAMIGSVFLLNTGVANNRALDTAILALVGTFCSFVAVTTVLVSRRLQTILRGLLQNSPLPQKEKLLGILDNVLIDRANMRFLLKLGTLATVVQLMRVGVHLLCAASLGMLTMQNFHYLFIFVPFLAIFMIIPMPFGIREGLEGTLLNLAGFGAGAVVIGFLATLASIVASLPGGIFFLTLRHRRNTRERNT